MIIQIRYVEFQAIFIAPRRQTQVLAKLRDFSFKRYSSRREDKLKNDQENKERGFKRYSSRREDKPMKKLLSVLFVSSDIHRAEKTNFHNVQGEKLRAFQAIFIAPRRQTAKGHDHLYIEFQAIFIAPRRQTVNTFTSITKCFKRYSSRREDKR